MQPVIKPCGGNSWQRQVYQQQAKHKRKPDGWYVVLNWMYICQRKSNYVCHLIRKPAFSHRVVRTQPTFKGGKTLWGKMCLRGNTSSGPTHVGINTLHGLIKQLPWGKGQLSIPPWSSNTYSLEVREKKNLAIKRIHHSCLSSWKQMKECTDIYQSFDCWRWLGDLVRERIFLCFFLATGSKTAPGFPFSAEKHNVEQR